MKLSQGEIIVFETDDGKVIVDVQLQNETVWLSQMQMQELFGRDQSVISRHVNNVFKEGELKQESNMQKMHIANSDKPVAFYNLDVIISVGYRVKSPQGTKFRIWATSILKDYLIKGYTINQKRLAEKGITEAGQMLDLLKNTLVNQHLVTDEGQEVLNLVISYAKTWQLLWQYDEDSMAIPKKANRDSLALQLTQTRTAISTLKKDLFCKEEATAVFGQERGNELEGLLGTIQQTFGGQDLYPTVTDKAANLLYFVIKDHPFIDGNKRIGSFLFLLFLQMNKETIIPSPDTMVALTLLIAASEANQKELLVKLIINLISEL